MSEVDLRDLSMRHLQDVAYRIERIQILRGRMDSSLVILGSAQGEGRSLDLPATVGHLSFERLLDLESAATRLLRLLMLDGLVFGDQPLEGLTEQGLLQRLGEILRMATQKGIVAPSADGLDEGVRLLIDKPGGAVGVLLDRGPEQAGNELPPDRSDRGGFVPLERDFPVVSHLDPLADPLVPRRERPPP